MEIGSGSGQLSKILLSAGLQGVAFDLNPASNEKNRLLNADYISTGGFEVIEGDFLEHQIKKRFDIILSSMVIEHLSPHQVEQYFLKCKKMLSEGGVIITMVPAGMRYWGIEDEVAGHFKRYEFSCFDAISEKHNLQITHMAGLTFPISNMLLGLSNIVVRRGETERLRESMQERTVASGNRELKYKTTFPSWMRLFLNSITMSPFHFLQIIFRRSRRCLMIYSEMQ